MRHLARILLGAAAVLAVLGLLGGQPVAVAAAAGLLLLGLDARRRSPKAPPARARSDYRPQPLQRWDVRT